MKQRANGFTIVELLIVIVVIAILAALSYVGYTNISQRANNTAIINAASGSLRLIQAYVAEYGTYPLIGNTSEVYTCITIESGCRSSGGASVGTRADFASEMARAGSLPKTAPLYPDRSGVFYFYRPNAITVDGELQSAWLTYWLEGTNQDCSLARVITGSYPFVILGLNYSNGNDGSKTRCNILIPGPRHA